MLTYAITVKVIKTVSVIINFKYFKKQGENAMEKENNEKEFGVMDDVVATGKKVGFSITDWKKFAQSEYIANRIFKFVNEFNRPHFSVAEEAEDTARKIANFTEAIRDYFGERSFCICCGLNQGQGKSNGEFLLQICEKFGIWLPSDYRSRLRGGDCFIPVNDVLYFIIKDFLGVEKFKNYKGKTMRLISLEEAVFPTSFVVNAATSSSTSSHNIILLKKAFEKKGYKLEINLNLALNI